MRVRCQPGTVFQRKSRRTTKGVQKGRFETRPYETSSSSCPPSKKQRFRSAAAKERSLTSVRDDRRLTLLSFRENVRNLSPSFHHPWACVAHESLRGENVLAITRSAIFSLKEDGNYPQFSIMNFPFSINCCPSANNAGRRRSESPRLRKSRAQWRQRGRACRRDKGNRATARAVPRRDCRETRWR